MILPKKKSPNRIFLSVPHVDTVQANAVEAVLRTGEHLDDDYLVSRLESVFSEIIHLPNLAVASGTAAMHMALRLAGVKKNDEVITPLLATDGSVNAIRYQEAKPVFVDSEMRSWNLDPSLVEQFLRERAKRKQLPRALILIHSYGQTADIDSFVQICRQYGVPLIEDARQSLGAIYKGRPAGASSDFGVYSFSSDKVITGTTGGILVAKAASDIAHARGWLSEETEQRAIGDSPPVEELGFSYTMSNIVAAIIASQLPLLEQRVRERRAIFARYDKELGKIPGWTMQPEIQFSSALPSRHSRWLSCATVNQTEFGMTATDLIHYLDAANVEAQPLSSSTNLRQSYRDWEIVGGSVAAQLNMSGIILPSSSSLTTEEQTFVIERVIEAHTGLN